MSESASFMAFPLPFHCSCATGEESQQHRSFLVFVVMLHREFSAVWSVRDFSCIHTPGYRCHVLLLILPTVRTESKGHTISLML